MQYGGEYCAEKEVVSNDGVVFLINAINLFLEYVWLKILMNFKKKAEMDGSEMAL